MTLRNVFEDVIQQFLSVSTFSDWNLAEVISKYVSDNLISDVSCQNNFVDWASETDENRFFLDLFAALLASPDILDWDTETIGTWISKSQWEIKTYFSNMTTELEEKLHNLFTLDGEITSLMDIAHLFSVMDVKTFQIPSYVPDPDAGKPSLEGIEGHKVETNFPLVQKEFKSCFDMVAKLNEEARFPCTEPIKHQECTKYCNWHKDYTGKTNLEEFLTLMKFGLPQRKWISDPVTEVERNLAANLFGEDNLVEKDQVSSRSPAPFAVLCKRGKSGYQGEEVGLSEPTCDDFYPTPSDQGMCMTENLRIHDIVMDGHEDLEFLLEDKSRKQDKSSLKRLTTSYVISVQSEPGDIYKNLESKWDLGHSKTINQEDLEEVQFQIHQQGDLSQVFNEAHFMVDTESIPLKRGHEYFIDVVPVGKISSDLVKNLNVQDRKCYTEDEVQENSMFKRYSESNCKYECRVDLARQRCQCIPWEYMRQSQFTLEHECDVFGRTCFFEEMKNLIEHPTPQCPHCLEACDFTRFRKIITSSKPLYNYGGFHIWEFSDMSNVLDSYSYLHDFIIGNDLMDEGLSRFSQMLNDVQKIRFNVNTTDDFKVSILNSMIVVHVRYLSPKVDFVDTTYTIWDKFANFGGNFGIFAEITGFSFLGTLNFFFLIIKYIISKVSAKWEKQKKDMKKDNAKDKDKDNSKRKKQEIKVGGK